MRARARKVSVTREAHLDYDETARLLGMFFGWSPSRATVLWIKALSRFVDPLEQGSYHGRTLPGNPHRVGLVTANPLTVFALYGAGYRRRVLLAARLRYAGDMNIVEMARAPGESNGRSRKVRVRVAGGRRRRARAAESLADLGFAGSSDFRRGWIEGGRSLDVLLAIQDMSEYSVRVIPVARVSQQMPPEAPPSTVVDKARRVLPWVLLRKATSLARTARTGSLKNARPLPLKTWSAEKHRAGGSSPPQVAELRTEVKKRFFSESRACSGPPSASKREVRRNVLADPFLRNYMQEYALREGLADEEVLDEASGYVGEIASDYRIGVARWVARFVDFIFDRFVDSLEIDKSGIRFITECDSRSRIVLVCSHKSYVDTLLMGYALLRSGLAPPQQAAGQNLTVWPVGWILRHCGAFYIRRTFAGETLYKEVFKAYVRYLLIGNYVSVLYVEGTRSRDGKLARPKLGYLSILADALRKGVCPDITLLPVYLGFDKIPEEGSHIKELTGGRKTSEGIGAFARIYRSVNTTIGRAFVKFGEPVSMRALLSGRDLEEAACSLCEDINSLTPVTGRSLAACGLLAPASPRVERDAALAAAGELMRMARAKGIEHVDEMADVERALDWLTREGHIEPEAVDGVEGFKVKGTARRYLEYNKNILIHHFAREALQALAARVDSGGSPSAGGPRADIEFLAHLLGEEFFFGLDGVASEEPSCRVEEDGARVLAALVEPFLEGYLVALTALGGLETGKQVPLDDLVEACFAEGERLMGEGSVLREESLSKVTFKNALLRFGKMGLVSDIRERDDRGYEKVTIIADCAPEDLAPLAERIRSFLVA